MKLELKHLAPYLPYGLRYAFDNIGYWSVFGLTYTGEKYDFGTMLRLTNPDKSKNPIGVDWDDNINGLSAFVELDSVHHKPILRPMSEVSDSLFEEIGFADEEDFIQSVLDGHILQINFNKLLSNHFDVFGLIPVGLAIDINTL